MDYQIKKYGYSGDLVFPRVYRNAQYVVKRSTKNKDRLIKCAHLQKQNSNFGKNIIAVPVLEIKRKEQYSEIIMPYKEGLNGENLYLYGNPTKTLVKCQSLLGAVLENLSKTKTHLSNEEFKLLSYNKLIQISTQIERKSDPKIPKVIKENTHNKLLSLLEQIKDRCPIGLVHGDLTFSNTIIDKDYHTVWLIDYLDSFITSPYVDLAKLVQELKYGWSARYLTGAQKTTSRILNRYAMETLNRELANVDDKFLHFFSLINLYRIAPYLSDEDTKSWLINALRDETS